MNKKSFTLKLTAITATFLTMTYPMTTFAEGEEGIETMELDVGDSIILEQNFDDHDLSKWSAFGGGNLSINEETGHSGNTSLKITERKNSYEGPSFYCDGLANAGDSYNFNGWVYHESDKVETFQWTMKIRDEFGSDNFKQIVSADIEPNTWTNLNADATIPAESVSTHVYIECGNPELDFSIDDIVVTGNSFVNAEEVVADFKDEYSMDFEEGFDDWSSRGEVTVAHTDEYSQSGNYSLFVSNRTEAWNGATVRISDKVIKGESYYYSAYVMYNGEETEDSQGFRMEMEYTLDGTITYNLVSAKTLRKGKWTKIDGYFTVPENAQNMALYIQTDNVEEGKTADVNDLMSYYVDNATICKGEIHKKAELTRNIIIIACSVIFIAIVGLIVSIIRRRSKKKKQVLELASLDAMTGIYNRNTYEKKIEELEKEGEKFKSLYFALCDVNFLKYINDNYGHEAGDEAIIRCAEMLTSVIGKSGSVYRIGGDEFVCISKVDFKDALISAIKKESAIDKGYPFEIASGFLKYDEKKYPTVKDIITECDKEMYENKQAIKAKNKKFSRK